ncbi:MAG TPA: cupin domain-containing protein [Kofleriaceae bacterium]
MDRYIFPEHVISCLAFDARDLFVVEIAPNPTRGTHRSRESKMEALDQVTRPSAHPPEPSVVADQLAAGSANHPVWKAQILRCISANWLYRDDMRFVLRIFSALEGTRRDCMSVLETRAGSNTGVRSISDSKPNPILSAWASELSETMDPTVELPTFYRYFALQCSLFCRDGDIGDVAAFLLGGELVMARAYTYMAKALREATDRPAPEVEPGKTRELAGVIASAPSPAGPSSHQAALEQALAYYVQLFEDLYQAVRSRRMATASDRIQARASLQREDQPPIPLSPGVGPIIMETRDDDNNIHFSVERYPGNYEALDPRVVRIPPGRTNNRHKHAHETLFYFISGTGRILVGSTWVPVKAGDAVFAPRWAIHQTHNTGNTELVLLAITDYYLTHQVYVGAYDKV